MSAGVMVGCESVCAACETRPATGRSVSGLPVCGRCAGDAEYVAREYARELEAARQRREAREAAELARVRQAVARLEDHRGADGVGVVVSNRARKPDARNSRAARRARGDFAKQANAEASARAKAVREAALVGALERTREPVTPSALALITGLSLATVKRGLTELAREKKVTARRDRRYALRAT